MLRNFSGAKHPDFEDYGFLREIHYDPNSREPDFENLPWEHRAQGVMAFEIGELMYEMRTRCGLSQQEMANLMHTQQSSVSRWERGVHLPSFWTLAMWSEMTRVPLFLCSMKYEVHLNTVGKNGALTMDKWYGLE